MSTNCPASPPPPQGAASGTPNGGAPVPEGEAGTDAPSWDDLCERMTRWVRDRSTTIYDRPQNLLPAISRLDRDQLEVALVAALAGLAIAADTMTAEQLWGWTRDPVTTVTPGVSDFDRLPHGTLAAARRHYRSGTDLCEECRDAQHQESARRYAAGITGFAAKNAARQARAS